jgi:nucleoside-diphosphate-sugar epimerase
MILITGGLGFIGSHTVQALLHDGEECVLVQRSHAGWLSDPDQNLVDPIRQTRDRSDECPQFS